jgi:hypothetical protein
MASERFDNVRQLGAQYWKPAVTAVAAIVGALTAGKDFLKQIGFNPDHIPLVGSSGATRWVIPARPGSMRA